MEARLAIAQWLLEAGVDPDGESVLSPSYTCAMCGNLDGLKLLRAHGADLLKPSRIPDGPAHSVMFAALVRDAKHVVRWLSKECGIVPTRADLADALAEREQAQQWLREELDEKQTETRWVSVAWDDWDFQYGKEQTALYEKANVQTVRAPYR